MPKREEYVVWCRVAGGPLIRYGNGSYRHVLRVAEGLVGNDAYTDWRLGRAGEPVSKALLMTWTRRGFEFAPAVKEAERCG